MDIVRSVPHKCQFIFAELLNKIEEMTYFFLLTCGQYVIMFWVSTRYRGDKKD